MNRSSSEKVWLMLLRLRKAGSLLEMGWLCKSNECGTSGEVTRSACVLSALLRNQTSRGGAYLTAEDLISLRLVGKELPFPVLPLHGAGGSLQCLLGGQLFTLLPFTQSTVAVPLLHAAWGSAPAGGLLHFAPVTLTILQLTAAIGRTQLRLAWGGQRSPRLAALPGRIKLSFALIVLIVTGQPVNGVVRICSRHPSGRL